MSPYCDGSGYGCRCDTKTPQERVKCSSLIKVLATGRCLRAPGRRSSGKAVRALTRLRRNARRRTAYAAEAQYPLTKVTRWKLRAIILPMAGAVSGRIYQIRRRGIRNRPRRSDHEKAAVVVKNGVPKHCQNRD